MKKYEAWEVGGNLLRTIITKMENNSASEEDLQKAASICIDYGNYELQTEKMEFTELLLKILASNLNEVSLQ